MFTIRPMFWEEFWSASFAGMSEKRASTKSAKCERNMRNHMIALVKINFDRRFLFSNSVVKKIMLFNYANNYIYIHLN